MKIHVDNVNLTVGSGPNTFARRLCVELLNRGHDLVDDGPSADVSLVFIERSGRPLSRRVVQRLDGIWFKPEEFDHKNKAIKDLYEKADAIVFQSNFDQKMIERWWGEQHKPTRIIGNGVNLSPIKELTIPALVEMRSQYDQIYVCSANWHPQKRLKANVELFHHLRQTQHPNSCLIVLGNHPDYQATGPHVFYTGPVGPDVYNQIYSAANWMLHLAWADHCPNVVVEALAQGTPVICSEVGGTKELIGHGAYGIIVKEQPYGFELADYDNPPSVDVTQIQFLPTRQELDYSGIASMIDIKKIVDRYVQLFEELNKR